MSLPQLDFEQEVYRNGETLSTGRENPAYYTGIIDLHGSIPLHRQSGIPGKVAGALLVARGIKNCVPLLHAPVGCAFQRKINPFRPWDLSFETPCSRITEVETVYGGNDKLLAAIKAVAAGYRPDLILVISTCAPDLIGDDFESITKEAEQEVGCPVVYTTGNARRMPVGAQDALTAVVKRLVEAPAKRLPSGVNICTLPAHNTAFKIAELKSLLEDIGAVVNGVYFVDSSVEEIKKLARAQLNITDYSQEWCQVMEKKFKIKNIALNRFSLNSFKEMPGSINGTTGFLKHIAEQLKLGPAANRIIEEKRAAAKDGLRSWREMLEGRRFAMTFFLHGGAGPVLVQDLGMECGVLVIKTPGLYRMLKKQAVAEILQRLLGFLQQHQKQEPLVLYDPTPAEEIAALKDNNIDLVLCPGMANLSLYLQEGLRVFDEGRFTRHQVRAGFAFVYNLARELVAVLERPVCSKPLLGLLDYSRQKERPHLTEYWASMVDCFQSIWFMESNEEE